MSEAAQLRASVVRVARRCGFVVACQVEALDAEADTGWWFVRAKCSAAASWPRWRRFGVVMRVELVKLGVEWVGCVTRRSDWSVCVHLPCNPRGPSLAGSAGDSRAA
jgi:hypothetical protein